METAVLKTKTVTCIGFDVQIISILYSHFCFPDYTAPPLFESRVTMLFKLMKSAEQISGTNMKISKISNINLMKNLKTGFINFNMKMNWSSIEK